MPDARILIADVVAATAAVTHTNADELRGPRSVHSIARPRQIAMDISVAYTGQRMSQVGRYFKRHHSTVRGAIEAVARRIDGGDEDTAIMKSQVLEALPGVVAKRVKGPFHVSHQ